LTRPRLQDGLKRAAWFVGLWAAGVLTVGMVGLLLRTVLA
jgi:hypothetical protein